MKLDDADLKGSPQNLINFKDQVLNLINFGKYQKQVLSAPPSFLGQRGEELYVMSGATGALYVCTSGGTSTWRIVATFAL